MSISHSIFKKTDEKKEVPKQVLESSGIHLKNDFQPLTVIMDLIISDNKKVEAEFYVFAEMDCNVPTYFAIKKDEDKQKKESTENMYVLKRCNPDESSISELTHPVDITDNQNNSVKILNNLKHGNSETKTPRAIYNPIDLRLVIKAEEIQKKKIDPKTGKPKIEIQYKYDEYIGYPFISGKRLDVFCKQQTENAFEKIVKLALNICTTLNEIEKFNTLLVNNNKPYRVLDGIWDINNRNMIVQEDNSVILIDYQAMRVSPYESFFYLLQTCLYDAAHIDITLTGGQQSLRDRLGTLLDKKDQNDKPIFNASAEAKSELLNIITEFYDKPKNFKFADIKLSLEKYVQSHFPEINLSNLHLR